MSKEGEKIAACFADLMVAIKDAEEAKERIGGHSWDYFASHYIDRQQRAAEAFKSALAELFDARIRAALKD